MRNFTVNIPRLKSKKEIAGGFMFLRYQLSTTGSTVGKALLGGVLSGSLLLSAFAGTGSTYQFDAKTEVYLANGRTSFLKPVNQAAAIRNVSISKAEGMVTATIEMDGQAKFNHFTLLSPFRVVVDIQNVTSQAAPLLEVGETFLRRVRVGQIDDSVRVVFDADIRQQYKISQEGTTLKIVFKDTKPNGLKNAVAASPAPAKTAPVAIAEKPAVVGLNQKIAEVEKPRPLSNPETMRPKVKAVAKQTVPAEPVQVQTEQAAVELPRANNPEPFKPQSAMWKQLSPATRPTNGLNAKAINDPRPPRAKSVKPAQVASAPLPEAVKQEAATKPMVAVNPVPNSKPRVVKSTPVVVPAPAQSEAKTTPVAIPMPKNRIVENKPVVKQPEAKTVAAAVPTEAPTPVPVRPREVNRQADAPVKAFNASELLKADFMGEPINLDLRSSGAKSVDIRDFLRFISDQYKVNFVLDQSVKEVPITISVQGIPWNQAMDAILRSNRLGVKVEGNIVRVMTQDTVTQEDTIRQQQVLARQNATALVTEVIQLNYARASGGAGGGAGGGSAAGSGGAASGANSTAGGSGLDGIIKDRLSTRGKIQADSRTNKLIITDLPENITAIKEIVRVLDVAESQVEIEARIVIANRNFARELGVQLSGVALNPSRGSSAKVDTSLGSAATTILNLTTGIFGTAQISAILTADEKKGNVKTISTPRITAANNTTANIVNGVQIPVQVESNNTISVSFVTAALRLEITPQITNNGDVVLKVVTENNSVNLAIATKAAPGINTQRAETTVTVPDGGTTIIGGINIDTESNQQARTPGISRIPGIGELFKQRKVSHQTDEILFFITPRVYRPYGTVEGTVK
jgi:type IV pilus secretin PilQ/predicted competence protein